MRSNVVTIHPYHTNTVYCWRPRTFTRPASQLALVIMGHFSCGAVDWLCSLSSSSLSMIFISTAKAYFCPIAGSYSSLMSGCLSRLDYLLVLSILHIFLLYMYFDCYLGGFRMSGPTNLLCLGSGSVIAYRITEHVTF